MKTKFYMALPVLLLLASLLGWALMISLAVDDPSFAVEEDYYQKAANFEEHQALLEESRELGWQAAVPHFERSGAGVALELRLGDPDRGPIDGAIVEVEALANVRAGDVQKVRLTEERPGSYSGTLPRAWPGLWELRIRATRGMDHFAEDIRVELQGGST